MDRVELVVPRPFWSDVFSAYISNWHFGIKMAKMVTNGRSSMHLKKASRLSKRWGPPQRNSANDSLLE